MGKKKEGMVKLGEGVFVPASEVAANMLIAENHKKIMHELKSGDKVICIKTEDRWYKRGDMFTFHAWYYNEHFGTSDEYFQTEERMKKSKSHNFNCHDFMPLLIKDVTL